MRRLADGARYVGGELTALLAIVLLFVAGLLPRRVPDLRRLTARRDVADARGLITSWLDRQFELIESQAPWLHPVARQVDDRCRTGWPERNAWSTERKPARVACTREVRISYGCDGDLRGLIRALASLLSAIGWGDVRGGSWDGDGGYGPAASQMLTLSWVSGGALVHELPSLAGLSDALRQSANMSVGWANPAEPNRMIGLLNAEASDRRRATLICQPVEAGGNAGALAAQALLSYEYAIEIHMSADYYQNENVNARPDRLRKRVRVISG